MSARATLSRTAAPTDPTSPLEEATKQYADLKLGRPVVTSTKTAPYTAVAGELVMVDATAGPITVTLPAAVNGQRVTVKKIDSSTNVVTIARAGSDTIGSSAATSVPVRLMDQATTVQANGDSPANWVVPHNHVSPASLDLRYDARYPALLAPTSVKTANYTAAVGELVLCDDSAGSFTVTLPAAATGAQVAVRKVVTSGNTVTVQRAGTDTIGTAGTSTALSMLDQQTSFQGFGTSWLAISNMLGLANLDARYAPKVAPISLMTPAAETALYNDIVSNGPRLAAVSAFALSATTRTVGWLVGWIPAGTVITGFRMLRTVAQSGGTTQIALYGSSSLSSTSWTRLAANFSGVLTGTGLQATAYGFTAATDMWIRAVLAVTTAPTTYATPLWLPGAGTGTSSNGLQLANGHPLVVSSNAVTAPGATLDPSSTTGAGTVTPWMGLY